MTAATTSVPAPEGPRDTEDGPRPTLSHDEAVAAARAIAPASGRTRPRPTGCVPCRRRPYASWTTPAFSTS
ncbi:hypothetical protein ACN24K_05630 [Streptomyces microflavus]